MLNRSGEMVEPLAGVEVVASDLYSADNVRKLCKGAKVVYQAAQPKYHQWVDKFPQLQQSIIDGLTGSEAKLVLVENLYMYGASNGKPMTEDLPYNAHTRKGKVRAEMSKAALAAHQSGEVAVAIGRGSDFFGPWGLNSTIGERVFYPLLAGKAAQATGWLDLPHTHTYTVDFGKTLVILGERSEADGQAWHVPNDMPNITQAELIRMIAVEAGVAPKMSGMGKFMMWMGGLFIPEARETLEMMYEFDKPFVVDSSKFETTFGMKATPLEQAAQDTVAWYKRHAQGKQ